MSGVALIHNKELLGQYTNGQCIPVKTARPSKDTKPRVATAPEPKKAETSWADAVIDFFFPRVPTITGCAEDSKEACQIKKPRSGAIEWGPQAGYDLSDPDRGPVTYKIYGIASCDGTIDGDISVTVNFGPEGTATATFEEAEDGTLTAVIQHVFEGGLSGEFPALIIDKYGNEKEITLYPPSYDPISTEGYKPLVGSLTIKPSSLNSKGQIVLGTSVVFDLPNTTDWDGEPSNLEVILYATQYSETGDIIISTPMTKDQNGIYTATVGSAMWGTPIYAEVKDLDRGTTATSYMWSLPPIVPPDATSCAADPKPRVFTVAGPYPADNYDIDSGQSVIWEIYGENCNASTNNLKAECYFGPLGTVTGFSDDSGVIPISTPLAEKLTGSFPCDITGSNGETLENGATLYPPYYAPPSSTQTVCEQMLNKPQVGPLRINPSSYNALGQLVLGSPVAFDLPNTTDCDDEPSNLDVTLNVESPPIPMNYNGQYYTVTIPANYWGTPITATVRDLDRGTFNTSSLYSLPPIVPPQSAKPKATVVIGPNPAVDYDVNSGTPVLWQIYTKNYDGTTTGLSASCDFGPLGTVTANSGADGVASISQPLTQKLTGFFSCDITGSNNEVAQDEAILYPPYYLTSVTQQTACEQNFGKPLVGGLSLNPACLNAQGQLVRGSTAIFDLPNTTDCDEDPSNLSVTLYAGTSSPSMVKIGGIYTASLQAEFWGVPIRAEVQDLDRGTSNTSYLYNLPPIVSPPDPRPRAFSVAGPNPDVNYDINSGTPVQWQIWTENYNGTTNGLSATCDFGPLGAASGVGNASGVVTIQKILTQRLTGSFPCDITGSNSEVRLNGAELYPPYYTNP